MDNKLIIDIKNITIDTRLVNVSAQVLAGQQIHILGANGAGKSTLLSAISGYLPMDGDILIDGKSIRQYRIAQLSKQRAYLPQWVNEPPILKVFQYIGLFSPKTIFSAGIFEHLCTDFQLTSLLGQSISQLSGGEWQRVRIIAAFLQVWDNEQCEGKFILLDEPTNNLDIIQQAMLDKWIKYFCDCLGTVIMSGHDLSHSYKNASCIWMLKQGQLVAVGKPECIMTEKNLSDIFMSEIKLANSTSHRVWQVINLADVQ
ncbi:ATP-binding cassette domain-containing protein [Providencia rettgeri]|uniref:vitamin B12 ABC transporter ATP-binding protein BtuD n=1 Tax=Providencia rettgeri TaxID=587 RepID=UPI002554F3C2|nr:ATP-binding cassette domain-containing protein [Providencia rettgeri]